MLKRALEHCVPNVIIYRKKMVFSIPLAEWFRWTLREKVATALASDRIDHTGLFDVVFLQRMVDERVTERQDHSPSLWSLLMFEPFVRNQSKRISS